jgi:hypothetical protein
LNEPKPQQKAIQNNEINPIKKRRRGRTVRASG